MDERIHQLTAEVNRMWREGEIAATGTTAPGTRPYELTTLGWERARQRDAAWNLEARRAGDGRPLHATDHSLAQWVAAYRGPLPIADEHEDSATRRPPASPDS